MAVLQARDVYRFFHTPEDEILALRGVDLVLDAGETVALMGPSGSGKSTLLACLSGLDEPDGGHVELLGRRLTRRPEGERARLRARHVGMLLQSGNLFEQLTVRENLILQMRLAGRFDAKRAGLLLAEVGLAERGGVLPGQLSGGEAARAGLAVALAADPSVLLADEPTGEVDGETETAILDILDRRRGAGASNLIATHSQALAARADRVVHLLDGQVSHG